MRRLVVLTGLPASGKSTIGRVLAEHLGAPFFDKDAFLEALFETQGSGDVECRQRLSRKADVDFQEAVRSEPLAVAASWWRHPRATSVSGTEAWWLQDWVTRTVEVPCACSPSRVCLVSRKIVTTAIFCGAVLVYIAGVSYSSGPLLLIGLLLEVWCLLRMRKRKPTPDR